MDLAKRCAPIFNFASITRWAPTLAWPPNSGVLCCRRRSMVAALRAGVSGCGGFFCLLFRKRRTRPPCNITLLLVVGVVPVAVRSAAFKHTSIMDRQVTRQTHRQTQCGVFHSKRFWTRVAVFVNVTLAGRSSLATKSSAIESART